MAYIVCLIIASHNSLYDTFIDLWREKICILNENKGVEEEDIRFYFVFSDPSLSMDVVCENDCILCKCDENLEPGIFLKTMMAIKFVDENMDYSYILRTNLSSFWNFPVLYSELQLNPIHIGTIFLQYLDRNNLSINTRWQHYFDIIDSVFQEVGDIFYFLDGAGFLLSRDMIRLLLLPISENYYSKLLMIPDDVAISILLFYNIIQHSPVQIVINEILNGKKMICNNGIVFINERNIGFIRNKDLIDRDNDVLNFKTHISFFYKKIECFL